MAIVCSGRVGTTAPLTMLSIAQQNARAASANRKAQRARKIADETDALRKRLCTNAPSTSASVRPSANRTSTASFSSESPQRALAALHCVGLDQSSKHDFAAMGITAYKFHVRSVSESLAQPGVDSSPPLYPSARAASLAASKVTRCVFDTAVAIADADVDRYAVARKGLAWHTPQMMIAGRSTRGAGIAMYSEESLGLVRTALLTAKAHARVRVEMEERHQCELNSLSFGEAGPASPSDTPSDEGVSADLLAE